MYLKLSIAKCIFVWLCEFIYFCHYVSVDVSIARALRHSPYLQGGSTCDSLSDSGISDGDSEGAGGRARRLSALRELARRLQAALAPNSPAHRAIAKVNHCLVIDLLYHRIKPLQTFCDQ